MSSFILHRGLVTPTPVAIGGDGVHLIDTEGRRYLDACGGAAVSCLGHSHPAVRDAVAGQLHRLAYAHTSFFSTAPAEELAEFLVRRLPPGSGRGRAIFSTSGSEAIESALKLARQYHLERGEPQRRRFIGRKMSFHGNTLAALSIGGNLQRRRSYEPLLPEASQISACHPYRGRQPGEDEAAYGRRVAAELEDEILRLGPESVAAFIAEPVVGATLGCVPPVTGYFRAIRDICDRHGVLLIADEVMCGIGRTGHLFALEPEGVHADITVVSKGLGAGYQPIACVLASERVAQALIGGSGRLDNGHTYMGHALGCAAALAVLKTIEAEDLLANVRDRGEQLRAALVDRLGQHPHVGDIRGRGLFLGIEFVADAESRQPFPRELRIAERLRAEAFARLLLCYPGSGTADGTLGDHVLIAPPYIVDAAETDLVAERLAAAVRAVLPR